MSDSLDIVAFDREVEKKLLKSLSLSEIFSEKFDLDNDFLFEPEEREPSLFDESSLFDSKERFK